VKEKEVSAFRCSTVWLAACSQIAVMQRTVQKRSNLEPSRLAEFLSRAIVDDRRTSLAGKVKSRLFTVARRYAARNNRRFVRYRLDGTELLIPLSHDLPIYRKAFPEYSENIGRVASYVCQKYPECRLIDIGANVGDTVAIVRSRCRCPILAIEGDDYYFRILEHNARQGHFADVTLCRAFVAASQGELSGNLISKDGSARFVENAAGSVASVRLSCLLEQHPEFSDSKLLKLDTDGLDCQIIESEIEWLARVKPVIFFEYDPHLCQANGYDARRVFCVLRGIGYQTAVFWDNTGYYLVTLELQRDGAAIEDIHSYFATFHGLRYVDVALFNSEDAGLAKALRSGELDHFSRLAAAFETSC
jgi:FkbM family methyltransferase